MNVSEFVKKWEKKDDRARIRLLLENERFLPDYKIMVDNDSVFVELYDHSNLENDVVTCDFDEFGYELLTTLFSVCGLQAELV